MDKKKQQVLEFISEHPGVYSWLTLKRFTFYWMGIWDLSPAYLLATPDEAMNIPLCTAITVLSLLGLRIAMRRDRGIGWIYALALLSVPIIYYFAEAGIQYRHPLDPLFMILAAAGATRSRA